MAGDGGVDSLDEIFASVLCFNMGGGPDGYDNVSYRCILDERLQHNALCRDRRAFEVRVSLCSVIHSTVTPHVSWKPNNIR